jgi:hypothetical protein
VGSARVFAVVLNPLCVSTCTRIVFAFYVYVVHPCSAETLSLRLAGPAIALSALFGCQHAVTLPGRASYSLLCAAYVATLIPFNFGPGGSMSRALFWLSRMRAGGQEGVTNRLLRHFQPGELQEKETSHLRASQGHTVQRTSHRSPQPQRRSQHSTPRHRHCCIIAITAGPSPSQRLIT